MLVMNPRAGKRKALSVRTLAERIAGELGVTLSVHTIGGIGHGTELAMQAVAEGCQRVVSVGGDGTNNSIAKGLIGTDVALGVVAMGSGNGYARSIGLPLKPEQAIKHAFTAPPKRMDVGYLNEHLFLGTAGIGFDARVADKFDKSSSRGMFTYARITVQDIFGTPPMPIELTVDGKMIKEDVLMLVFCNTREFGNGADISPTSKPDDGIAELRVVRKPPIFQLVKAFYDVYTHRADSNPNLVNITATKAFVKQAGTLAHLDGEPVEIGHEVRFKLEQGALWVVG